MNKEYLGGNDFPKQNVPKKPPDNKNIIIFILLAVIAVLLAVITAVCVVIYFAKNQANDPNKDADTSVSETVTRDSGENASGIVINDGLEGITFSKEKTEPTSAASDSTSTVSQPDQHTQSTGTTATPTKPAVTERPTSTEKPISNVKIGDYIKFGKYEQDNNTSNGKETIEWLVLDVKDGRVLVISKYALDAESYNNEYENVTWETSTLRKWLNNDFYNAAFTSTEKNKIKTTTVVAEDNPEYGTEAGNNTQDKIFLLSISEANKYFGSNKERMCKPTAYAKSQGVMYYSVTGRSDYGNCTWWLRTPAQTNGGTVLVDGMGNVENYSFSVATSDIGIRPAMWISI